jgi:S-adenosylmethionine hydrolase
MTSHPTIITLLTDFGSADTFVGVMKGVLLGALPGASIVDLTHDVPAQDVELASYHLENAWPHFPEGTVHLAVVDPGVGSSRRAIVVAAYGHVFVAPDNGLLSPVLHGRFRAFVIDPGPAPLPSATFHGRDLFAPAAARLAAGADPASFGPPVSDPVRLPVLSPRVISGEIAARVVQIDRFGNVILNVRASDLRRAAGHEGPMSLAATVANANVEAFVTHYAEAASRPCFLINSDGRLELAVPGGSAAAQFGLYRRSEVIIRIQ